MRDRLGWRPFSVLRAHEFCCWPIASLAATQQNTCCWGNSRHAGAIGELDSEGKASREGGKPPQRSPPAQVAAIPGLPVREFDQHLTMTPFWRTPIFASETCNKCRRSMGYVYDNHILCTVARMAFEHLTDGGHEARAKDCSAGIGQDPATGICPPTPKGQRGRRDGVFQRAHLQWR